MGASHTKHMTASAFYYVQESNLYYWIIKCPSDFQVSGENVSLLSDSTLSAPIERFVTQFEIVCYGNSLELRSKIRGPGLLNELGSWIT
jgi:hypothetical protein